MATKSDLVESPNMFRLCWRQISGLVLASAFLFDHVISFPTNVSEGKMRNDERLMTGKTIIAMLEMDFRSLNR